MMKPHKSPQRILQCQMSVLESKEANVQCCLQPTANEMNSDILRNMQFRLKLPTVNGGIKWCDVNLTVLICVQ
jgi:hypothetical protein